MSSAHSEVAAHCLEHSSPAIEMVVRARSRDLGGLTVRRTLPSTRRRLVGPFVFFDHMGPVTFPPDTGIDVRPHPHIGLATVTYLFEGELFHRDTLGSAQAIHPGDVNWMVAGRGIAHSERTPADARRAPQSYHGIQAWVALPREHEEGAPSFSHHPGATLPSIRREGAALRVIAGEAYGARSPVSMTWPTLYVDAILESGATLELPDAVEERAVYVAKGRIGCEGDPFDPGDMIVLVPGARVAIQALTGSRVLVLGGAPMDGPRFIEWNFVASSQALIERAKEDWKHGRFEKVPGDEVEFIPLPER